jgi:hypothetical protein
MSEMQTTRRAQHDMKREFLLDIRRLSLVQEWVGQLIRPSVAILDFDGLVARTLQNELAVGREKVRAITHSPECIHA